jgi:hypothetical protein
MMLSGVMAGEEAWVAAEAWLGSWDDTPARRDRDFAPAVGQRGLCWFRGSGRAYGGVRLAAEARMSFRRD